MNKNVYTLIQPTAMHIIVCEREHIRIWQCENGQRNTNVLFTPKLKI